MKAPDIPHNRLSVLRGCFPDTLQNAPKRARVGAIAPGGTLLRGGEEEKRRVCTPPPGRGALFLCKDTYAPLSDVVAIQLPPSPGVSFP